MIPANFQPETTLFVPLEPHPKRKKVLRLIQIVKSSLQN